jgi:Glycosyltransferase
MKILLVITKAVVGGAQMSVLNLARELKSRGHEITVGFGDGDFLPAELDKEKIPYTRFSNLKRTHNPLAGLLFIFEIRKYLRANPPLLFKEGPPVLSEVEGGGGFNVVHFNSSNALPGALGAKLSGRKIKTFFTFRGMSMLDEHYRINFILRLIYRWFFKFFLLFVDAPVFVSKENFNKFGRGQLTAKGILIYNGLDPEKMNFITRDEARKFFSDKIGPNLQNKFLIGSLGRLDYAKNYEFLINIMPEILKIKPDAAGDNRGGKRAVDV